MDSYLLIKYAEIEAIVTEVKGMESENNNRLRRGESIAYPDTEFNHKADDLRFLANRIAGEHGK